VSHAACVTEAIAAGEHDRAEHHAEQLAVRIRSLELPFRATL
jgi:hypothetical protein